MKCPKCNFEVAENAKFCQSCGEKMPITEEESAVQAEDNPTIAEPLSATEANLKKKNFFNNKKIKLVALIAGGLVLIAALILATIFVFLPLSRKIHADSLMKAGNYVEAYNCYDKLSKVPGVSEVVPECAQKAFDQLAKENDYEAAYNLYFFADKKDDKDYIKNNSEFFAPVMEYHLSKKEFEHAQQLEKQGSYAGAYYLYKDLAERGFYTDYAEHAEELYNRYRREVAVYQTIENLKKSLKDPNSLALYEISTTVIARKSNNTEEYLYEVALNYGARNSFGGMVRDVYVYTLTGDSEDQDQVAITNYHDSLANKTRDQWREEVFGDYKEYHSNFAESNSANIWNQMK